MYNFKREFRNKLLSGATITYVANKIGITPKYLGDILAGRTSCAKKTAYLICKCICFEAEISDYFIRVEE